VDERHRLALMPTTVDAAYRAKARRGGGGANVPPLPCPDLGGRVFWPDMPWHLPAAGLEVDEIRTAMLAEVDVPIRARSTFRDNVRSGTPYQLVDGMPLTKVWPVGLFDGLGWKVPLPPVVTRFGDPTGFLSDSQWLGIDLSGEHAVLWEAGTLGVGWRGWQARRVWRSDTGRPFEESGAATASRIPMLALMPRPEELLAGRIPRALAVSLPSSPRWHWPARFSDGLHPSHPIEYGDRLVLPPERAAELRAVAPNIETVAIIDALEEFGAYAADRTMREIDAAGNIRLPMAPGIDVQVLDGEGGLRLADFVIVKDYPRR
jgi:hypothetical protein